MDVWRPWDIESVCEDINICDNVEQTQEDASCFRPFIHEQTQQVVLNVYNYFMELDEADATNRTSVATKVSLVSVRRIVNHGVVTRKRKKSRSALPDIGHFEKEAIERIIYEEYSNNRVPTLDSILVQVKDNIDFPYGRTSLYRSLRTMGFLHKKLDKRLTIMESNRIQKLRAEYLVNIKKYRREENTIIYLDETWFDTHDVVSSGWVKDTKKCVLKTPCSRGKRLIILHAGSKDGWVKGALLLSAKNIKCSSADYHVII